MRDGGRPGPTIISIILRELFGAKQDEKPLVPVLVPRRHGSALQECTCAISALNRKWDML